jgi:hypothetical protein
LVARRLVGRPDLRDPLKINSALGTTGQQVEVDR